MRHILAMKIRNIIFFIEAKMIQKNFIIASWIATFGSIFLLSQTAMVAFATKSELEGTQRMLDTTEAIHANYVAQLLSAFIPKTDRSTIRLPFVLKSAYNTDKIFREELFKNLSNDFIVTYTNDQVLVKRRD